MTPHHLLLTDELAATYDPVYKVNPPLRSAADVEALRAGLADGTIDIVATDHAPHPHEDKDCEWAAAAFGMLGLETALSVVQQTMVDTGLLDWAGVAERMSYAPARIGRLTDHGRPLEDGAPANVVLYDPAATPGGRRGRDRLALAQHAVRRPRAARSGRRHLPARQGHRAGRQAPVGASCASGTTEMRTGYATGRTGGATRPNGFGGGLVPPYPGSHHVDLCLTRLAPAADARRVIGTTVRNSRMSALSSPSSSATSPSRSVTAPP